MYILIVSSGMIYLNSISQVAPNAYEKKHAERIFYFDKLKSIEVNRGFWTIDVIPSDSNLIKIEGGVKLLNYHLNAGQTGSSIIVSLYDSIVDEYLYDLDVKVYSKSLENIDLKSFAEMQIDSARFDMLNVNLKENSRLQVKDCQISDLELNTYDFSTFESEACRIGNANTWMYDSSYAIIYSADNVISEEQKGFSVLMTYDDKNKYSTYVSDSLRLLTNFMPEYFDSLKWLMLFDTVLRYSGKYEYNILCKL